jgi:hypothetical protein
MAKKKGFAEIFRRLLRPGDVPVADVVAACDFIDATPSKADRSDVEMVCVALAALLGSNPSPEITGLVAFALGKKQDHILLGLFDRALVRMLRDLNTCHYALYQCLIAIDNIKPIFSGSASSADIVNNISAASRRIAQAERDDAAARGRKCQEVGRSCRSRRPKRSPSRRSPPRCSAPRAASTTTPRTLRTPMKSSRSSGRRRVGGS